MPAQFKKLKSNWKAMLIWNSLQDFANSGVAKGDKWGYRLQSWVQALGLINTLCIVI